MSTLHLAIAELTAQRDAAQELINKLIAFQAGANGALPASPERDGARPPAGEDRPVLPRRLLALDTAGELKRVPRGTGKQNRALTAGRPGGFHKDKIKPPTPVDSRALTSAATTLDQPETVGGWMKLTIQQHAQFTGQQMREWMQAIPPCAKLLDDYCTQVAANLSYWAKTGKLTKQGDSPLDATYTVTPAGKEWFAK